MLRFRETQLQAFERQQGEHFAGRVVAFLREQFGDYAAVPQDQMLAAAARFMRAASGYGLESERQIVCFVLAAHYLGHDFDTRNQTCNATLRDGARTPDWKADWLEAMCLIIEGKREKGEL